MIIIVLELQKSIVFHNVVFMYKIVQLNMSFAIGPSGLRTLSQN